MQGDILNLAFSLACWEGGVDAHVKQNVLFCWMTTKMQLRCFAANTCSVKCSPQIQFNVSVYEGQNYRLSTNNNLHTY